MTKLSFHANGKLLLSGEYFVLDGAEAIGLPCQYGQDLSVNPQEDEGFIFWKSKTVEGDTWYEGIFKKEDLSILKNTDQKTSETLQHILQQAKNLNPDFLKNPHSISVETNLEFPRLWGLGTSSTLIFTIAQWGQVDPFQLSNRTLGGSGYDIACAGVDHPILYQRKEEKAYFKKVNFDPDFKDQLYFIYLTKKQDSREGIKRYRAKAKNNSSLLNEISALSQAFLKANTLSDFQKIILEHEHLVSKTIEMPKAQDLYFSDFEGTIKSLGAWGGDFVLAATELEGKKVKAYFNKKGYNVFLSYKEMAIKGTK